MTCQVISITNQKGGVGKTTTTINVATAMAAAGQRVLLIDCDPQANATAGLGITSGYPTLYEFLGAQKGQVTPTALPHLSLIPASQDLSAFDVEVIHRDRREYLLKDLIQSTLAHQFDTIFLDCPPSLNMITVNALAASNDVLVPLQCEFFALQGLAQLLKTIDRVKSHINPSIELLGVVLTMYEKRSNLCQMVETEARKYLKNKVFQTVIPRNIKISESSSHGKPVLFYDFKSAGAQAYVQLAREILQRQGDRR